MPGAERLKTVGQRRGIELVGQAGRELRELRLQASVSQAELARSLGVSRTYLCHIELGQVNGLDMVLLATAFALLGHRLTWKAWPVGEPVRDRAQLRLIERFEAELRGAWRRRREAVMPIRGDLRAWDLLLDGPVSIGVEAETRLRDVQALVRAVETKQRDSAVVRVVLLLARTHHNRDVVRGQLPALRATFPLTTREVLRALRRGTDPGASGIVLL
jgi:transcriptional regulator with XRE-family HTH domain